MSDEFDERLRGLFADAHETLPSADFMQTFLVRLERAHRARNLQRVALLLGLGVAAAWIMPTLLATTALVAHAAAEKSRDYAALLISPAGWAASMLVGLLVLLRTGALRRR